MRLHVCHEPVRPAGRQGNRELAIRIRHVCGITVDVDLAVRVEVANANLCAGYGPTATGGQGSAEESELAQDESHGTKGHSVRQVDFVRR